MTETMRSILKQNETVIVLDESGSLNRIVSDFAEKTDLFSASPVQNELGWSDLANNLQSSHR